MLFVCVYDVQDTVLELMCDAVASSVRQGKSLVVTGFPRDLRRTEEYEAKVRGQRADMWGTNRKKKFKSTKTYTRESEERKQLI